MRHLCFKYLKMIISTNYALKQVFPKAFFFQKFIDLKVVKKCAHSNCATCVNSREILCILLESS